LLEVGDDQTIRFLSIEPQWEASDTGEWLSSLDWMSQGGQSGRNSPAFDIAWAQAMRNACQKARVRYFLNHLGANVRDGSSVRKLRDRHGGDWSEWPADLRIREFPVGVGCNESVA
jgi:protein gp37